MLCYYYQTGECYSKNKLMFFQFKQKVQRRTLSNAIIDELALELKAVPITKGLTATKHY